MRDNYTVKGISQTGQLQLMQFGGHVLRFREQLTNTYLFGRMLVKIDRNGTETHRFTSDGEARRYFYLFLSAAGKRSKQHIPIHRH